VARVPTHSGVLFPPPSSELEGDGPGAVLYAFLLLLFLPCCNGCFGMLQQIIFEYCNRIFGSLQQMFFAMLQYYYLRCCST
jgi:hypothetical protein